MSISYFPVPKHREGFTANEKHTAPHKFLCAWFRPKRRGAPHLVDGPWARPGANRS